MALTKAQKRENEIINKAKELRMEFHGVDLEELKPWDELSDEKQQRWLNEAAAVVDGGTE